MKAVQLHGHGGVEQLRFGDAATPILESADDAIVKLGATALNHRDLLLRRGETATKLVLPVILGSDGAGTVVALGSRGKDIRVGDAVCIYPWHACGTCAMCNANCEALCPQARRLGETDNGTYAEYVRVPARNCFPIPANFSFEEAAAFPSVFVIVWRMLVTNAELKPGESALILGIGGGIATAALQLANRMGARVIATSSSDEKLARARSHGAKYVINHRKTDFPLAVRSLTNKRGVDVVVDCLGGAFWAKSLASLAKGGRLVSCGAATEACPATDLRRIFWNHLRVFGSASGSRAEFRQVLNFLAVSQTKPIIDRVLPLKDAARAQERLEKGQQFGKIVLRMDA
ncbi:MAG TPA: zinc-binding dehydrogenase [Candidatus Limnocylindria bacterium]|nr:zinc-binding dehydrogenase [Candidatus Limnocylindria bacterium]